MNYCDSLYAVSTDFLEQTVFMELESSQSITYGELQREIRKWVVFFSRNGVTRGDCVAIHLHNGLHFILAHMAAQYLGAVSALMDPLSQPKSLRYYLDMTNASMLVTHLGEAQKPEEYAPLQAQHRGEAQIVVAVERRVLADGGRDHERGNGHGPDHQVPGGTEDGVDHHGQQARVESRLGREPGQKRVRHRLGHGDYPDDEAGDEVVVEVRPAIAPCHLHDRDVALPVFDSEFETQGLPGRVRRPPLYSLLLFQTEALASMWPSGGEDRTWKPEPRWRSRRAGRSASKP